MWTVSDLNLNTRWHFLNCHVLRVYIRTGGRRELNWRLTFKLLWKAKKKFVFRIDIIV